MVTEICPEEIINDCGNYPFKTPGSYGVKNNSVKSKNKMIWEHCRDRVQIISKTHFSNGLWFSHRKNKGQNVISFLSRLETILKVKTKSKFGKTNLPENIIWIDISPFWTKNLVRRSFLTMALRCGQNYSVKKDNILNCFEKNKYGKPTMKAIEMFLNGYTHYTGGPLHMFQGWFRLFKDKSEDQIKELMKNEC